jgi:hypothetical protein
MARIAQIRDVILVRQQEDLERSLTYKEIEVQALMSAIHAAAGNGPGVKAAAGFRFHAKPAEPAEYRKVVAVFRPDAEGLITDEALAAEIERQRGLL